MQFVPVFIPVTATVVHATIAKRLLRMHGHCYVLWAEAQPRRWGVWGRGGGGGGGGSRGGTCTPLGRSEKNT